mmetsp:Transcript_8404/g.20803  ORF Transcript_8404/g.20803 Transcript_8404/m.20803 type:complete len:218 (+) Transcript_8404:3067-3720(+)
MRRLEGELHHLHVHLDRQLLAVRHCQDVFLLTGCGARGVRRHLLRSNASLLTVARLRRAGVITNGSERSWCARLVAAGVQGEAARIAWAGHVGPPAGHFLRRREERARACGHADDRVHHRVELALACFGAQPLHKLAPQHVHGLVDLMLRYAPAVKGGAPRLVQKVDIPLVARGEEDHTAHNTCHVRQCEIRDRSVSQHEKHVTVDRAEEACVCVEQ